MIDLSLPKSAKLNDNRVSYAKNIVFNTKLKFMW